MRIYFSPGYPRLQDYSIVAMIHCLGYSVVRNRDEDFDFGFLWEDATHVEPDDFLMQVSRTRPVLNLYCRDISKRNVDRIWSGICGYGSLVDPCKYQGRVIRKSDENGRGGGELIDCPLLAEALDDTCVYQKYIATAGSGAQLEYRLPFIMGKMPLVFKVFKDDPEQVLDRRIQNQFKHSIVAHPSSDIFSAEECDQIAAFCRSLGMDIGELDVLRCGVSGRLYVIDANTTPTYFSMLNRYWQVADKRAAVHMLAECWEKQIAKLLVG